jgi:16S rRNA (cytidine1402-2'-O)-methyltransferase
MPMNKGQLFLIPTPLGEMSDAAALPFVLPAPVMQRAATLTHWIAENAKTCRAFLKSVSAHVPLAQPIQALHIAELPKHSALDSRAAEALLAPTRQGHDIGLVSEAGAPAVADPGALIVAAAHRLNIAVVPCVGPSSLLLALMASGLDGQRFAFHGYLPKDARERSEAIKALEARSRQRQETQLVIETPYRNAALFQALVNTLSGSTRLCIASGLSTPEQSIRMMHVEQWKQDTAYRISELPSVFCWLA